jgi:hypothetical protein
MLLPMSANPRLAHLLELADKGPALRAALAEEVAALLMEWPDECPNSMRPVFENLLAKTARAVDADTRARLRVRLFADRELAARILPREQDAMTLLIEAMRLGGDITAPLAEVLGLDAYNTAEILKEASGEALAIACKGAGLSRLAYSTLALLALPSGVDATVRLEIYDRIATLDAARTLRAWRGAKLHIAEAATAAE